MKKILLFILLAAGFAGQAQVYNNEWIDYSKTYYKFKVGRTGLYRIPQAVLATAGLGAAPAQQFQLWRNGVQVPIYTSAASGTLAVSDYIEFWGLMNDGKPDNELYRDPSAQYNNKWSLETDTAAYFLTINAAGNNLRLQTAANNVAGNTLAAEPYFMYTLGQYFKDRLSPGPATVIGSDYLFSSSYEKGEGYSSSEITTYYNGNNNFSYGVQTLSFSNLAVYTGGGAPQPQFKIAVSGSADNTRRFKASINNDSVTGATLSRYSGIVTSVPFNLSTLATNGATVQVANLNSAPGGSYANDRILVHQYEIIYPRQFDFGGAANFEFTLPASAAGNYLRISNFAAGGSTPVLYDLTNGRRYDANTAAAALLQFVLPPSATDRALVLVAEASSNITMITTMQQRSFKNYTAAAAQGNYLIISNPLLYAGSSGNPVEQYRQYRSSAAGGGYTAQIYEADELIDQFGFGIKKNPAGIRNFIAYARSKYSVLPKQVFIIGHGLNYPNQRAYETGTEAEKLNMIPTFGYPSSDNLLAAPKGSSAIATPIGRLSALSPADVENYLRKVKDYELMQNTLSGAVKDKAWMKNVVHIAGIVDPLLGPVINSYIDNYARIIKDTVFGAKVSTFRKISTNTVETINDSQVPRLFEEGISLMTYFGHSSSTTLEFNLDKPENYNNYKKYPIFLGLGCLVGDYFNYSSTKTLPETYVLAPDKGMIGFISSTHFGVVDRLDVWSNIAYRQMAYKSYGKTIGEVLKATGDEVFTVYDQNNDGLVLTRSNIEQLNLHGDPAIRLNYATKPDYVVEDSMVKVTPDFVSVADGSFKIEAKFLNIGMAPEKNVTVKVSRQYPNGTTEVVYTGSLFKRTVAGQPSDKFTDSIALTVPVNGLGAKGVNKIIVSVDPDNAIDELFENNNTVTKQVTVFEDEARPVYPYNYSIVNKQNIKVAASTANALAVTRQYKMEMDTTELFNSSLKISKTLASAGGLLEFDPGITYRDSTVYYWRVSPVLDGGQSAWSNSSFIFLSGSSEGFSQSHFYQHTKSVYERMHLDTPSRQFVYNDVSHNIFIQTGVYPYPSNQGQFYGVTLDGVKTFGPGCSYDEIVFNVIDPINFQPWLNNGGAGGQYGSSINCGANFARETNFNFPLGTAAGRKLAMDFFDRVPNGYYIIVRNNPNGNPASNTYAAVWQADTSLYGRGNSLYHRLRNQGFTDIDSLNVPKAFGLAFKKNQQTVFKSSWTLTKTIYESATMEANLPAKDSVGFITSPAFGPAKLWKQLQWRGSSADTTSGDIPAVDVIGITTTGQETVLVSGLSSVQQNYDVSGISAAQYPYLKLKLRNADKVNATPWQMRYWRLLYTPVAEGAVAPNIYFKMKDTVDVSAAVIDFAVAFKNISDTRFDSLKVKMYIRDKNNVVHNIPISRLKPLNAADTVQVQYKIDGKTLTGLNTLYIEFNPDDDQPEQQHFNNFLFKNFFVVADTVRPLLDVTFDNIHILNRDIVAAKPSILIKLKDNAGLLLTDPSMAKVQVKYPDGTIHPYAFDNTVLKFNAAQGGNEGNTATIEFKPAFPVDGEYELIVFGKDMSGNEAGTAEYRILFQVINKPMISNMLNYPNPFTTSTAFVFTVTGSEVPQNIRIQILTITGKIVREVTMQELGNVHIGRNITEFKWDGTDQYGQKLANGVYLYRVITNLNGKSLDKYRQQGDNTDQYFNKGYGKMYLMR